MAKVLMTVELEYDADVVHDGEEGKACEGFDYRLRSLLTTSTPWLTSMGPFKA